VELQAAAGARVAVSPEVVGLEVVVRVAELAAGVAGDREAAAVARVLVGPEVVLRAAELMEVVAGSRLAALVRPAAARLVPHLMVEQPVAVAGCPRPPAEAEVQRLAVQALAMPQSFCREAQEVACLEEPAA